MKQKITREIMDTPGSTYSENEVGGAVANCFYHSSINLCFFWTAAVKRKHEGRRKRQKDEEKENFEEVQQFVNRRKKYRA